MFLAHKTLLADCTATQLWMGVESSADAAKRIFLANHETLEMMDVGDGETHDKLSRPFILIYFAELTVQRWGFRVGTVVWRFEKDVQTNVDPDTEPQILDFMDGVDAIIDEAMTLSENGGYAVIQTHGGGPKLHAGPGREQMDEETAYWYVAYNIPAGVREAR
jgi:hypothetical protein